MLAAGNDNIRARVLHVKWRLRQEFPQTFKEAVADNPVDAVYYHKPTYTKYLAGASFGTDTPENESAVCLLMVLSQARGSTFDPENVGATSIGTKNIGGRDFQVFVDQTRLPIAFARWTTNVAVLDEYSLPPHVPTGATFLDPQDPEGKLVNLPAGVLAVLNGLVDNQVPPQKLLHPIGPAPTDNRNRTWIIYAAGHDKIYGNQDDLLSFRLRGTGKAGN